MPGRLHRTATGPGIAAAAVTADPLALLQLRSTADSIDRLNAGVLGTLVIIALPLLFDGTKQVELFAHGRTSINLPTVRRGRAGCC